MDDIKTIEFLKETISGTLSPDFAPEIALVLGSGLGEFADEHADLCIPYSKIPNFEVSTVAGHKGQLIFAEIAGKRVVMMQGRFHFYEGHSINQVVFPIKIFKKLGVKKVILTNAAGGINTDFQEGDLMLIKDHLNMMGTNPLIGVNDDTLGERFPDMSEVYSQNLRNIAKSCAEELKIHLSEGVYAAQVGPSYETPAEIKMLRILGADAVGMSTVPEAIVANYCKMEVLGISCITNFAAGISKNKLSHQEVIETANRLKSDFKKLLLEIIKNI